MWNYRQVCPECYYEVLLDELDCKVNACPNCGGKKIAWQKIEKIENNAEPFKNEDQDIEEKSFEEFEKEYDIYSKTVLTLKYKTGIIRSNFEIMIEEDDSPCMLGRSGFGSEYFETDKRISNEHFCIIIEDEKWELIDEGSTNGTYINGQRVRSRLKVVLKDGDMIKLGSTDTSMILEVHINAVG